jgi:hypothetical protein
MKKNPLSTTALWTATAAPNAPDISVPWSSTAWKEIPASSKIENRNLTSQAADFCIGERVRWVGATGYGLVFGQL